MTLFIDILHRSKNRSRVDRKWFTKDHPLNYILTIPWSTYQLSASGQVKIRIRFGLKVCINGAGGGVRVQEGTNSVERKGKNYCGGGGGKMKRIMYKLRNDTQNDCMFSCLRFIIIITMRIYT